MILFKQSFNHPKAQCLYCKQEVYRQSGFEISGCLVVPDNQNHLQGNQFVQSGCPQTTQSAKALAPRGIHITAFCFRGDGHKFPENN